MLNGQLCYDLAFQQEIPHEDYRLQQVDSLLKTGACELVYGEDYELEAGACAVNALVGEYISADIYLYAAIERQDWKEVLHIYENIFRPELLKAASLAVDKALSY